MTSICEKNEYINIKTERHFVLGGVMLFVIIMLHYMIPGFFIDLLTSIMLLIINLSLTVVLLNYQDIYQRLSAIVRFVASNDDYSGDEKIVPGRLIRSKLNEWCDRLCVNIGHKELSLNTISNELNVEPAHLYEFIKYEFGENYEQWIVGLRLRCVCNNLDKYQDLEQLADIAGFCNVEIMKKAFYDAKHLSIEQFKLLNWGDYEENNRNNKFCIWVYDPVNRNVRRTEEHTSEL